MKIDKYRLITVPATVLMLSSVGSAGLSASAKTHHSYQPRVHRMARLPRHTAVHALYRVFRSHHLSEVKSLALIGVAYHESGLKSTAKEAGGGTGYGLYQVNRSSLRSWARRHHMSYKTNTAQAKYLCAHMSKAFRHAKPKSLNSAVRLVNRDIIKGISFGEHGEVQAARRAKASIALHQGRKHIRKSHKRARRHARRSWRYFF